MRKRDIILTVPMYDSNGPTGIPSFTYYVVKGKPDPACEKGSPPISIGVERNLCIELDNEKYPNLIGFADTLENALVVIGTDMARHASIMVDMLD